MSQFALVIFPDAVPEFSVARGKAWALVAALQAQLLGATHTQNAPSCRLRGISFDYWMLESKPEG
jgi:hypothetical protein